MTPVLLETFRAPRPDKRFLAFLGVVVFCGLGLIGNEDFKDQQHIEAEKRQHAARLAQPSPAPLYVKRCLAKGQDFIATQADGGKWVVTCVGKPIRT